MIRSLPAKIILAGCLLLTACHPAHRLACNPDVMCTMLFKMITVHITDGQQRPVQLDEAYTLRISNGEKIRFELNPVSGNYTVLDDSYQKRLQNTAADFKFVGYRHGKVVVEQSFRIGADCCHINLVTGATDLVVKP